MTKPLPPLSWLLAFDTAARHLSMTGAARELGLSQSAISQQIRLLEHRVNLRLFKRLPKGLELTDDGRRLLPQVTESIAGLTQVLAEFDTDPNTGPLTVAASISFARSFIAPSLSGFLACHPKAQVRMRSTLWPDDYSRSDSDIEIRFAPTKRLDSTATLLCPDHVIVVCAPDFLPTDAKWSQIVGARRIDIVGMQQNWDKWCAKLNLPKPAGPAQLVDSHGLAMDFARAGVGVTLSNLLLAAPYLLDGSLIMPTKYRLPADEGYSLTLRKDVSNPFARPFAEWIEQEVRALSAHLQVL